MYFTLLLIFLLQPLAQQLLVLQLQTLQQRLAPQQQLALLQQRLAPQQQLALL